METKERKQVVIVGGGFAGINAARILGRCPAVSVMLIDRRNHHLFQPLLYQVAMAGLSPAEIAAPIRGMLSEFRNTEVLQGEVTRVDLTGSKLICSFGDVPFDYLILACGTRQGYFGNEHWERNAPGLKSLEQATEIRRRVLTAFEKAERTTDPAERRRLLTFVIIGGGPTGVELAGAIGEMSRFTLARDFRHVDPKLTRIMLIEGGSRILPTFAPELASRATRDLEKLGVQIWTNSLVSNVDPHGVDVGSERVEAATVLWAAGVEAEPVGKSLGAQQDRVGRVIVGEDLSIAGHPNVFVAGDMAMATDRHGQPLPGLAPVALQQGRYLGQLIRNELEKDKPRKPFRYVDKGQMATIGRSRAIVQTSWLKFGGPIAWLLWLVIHVYYLTGFRNRLFVVVTWAWSYVTFKRGARLITNRDWQTHTSVPQSPD